MSVIHFSGLWLGRDLRQLFAKYNKNYQDVNSKRLQLTAVYFLTLNGHLALFFNFDIMTSDIYIHAVDTPTTGPQRAARDRP
jgi:hypothetical protein